MGNCIVSLVIAVLLGFTGASAWALETATAGRIKTLIGSAEVARGESRQPASVGLLLLSGDRITTQPRSVVGITLADDTLLSIGPSTQLRIDDFRFDPTTHDGSLLATLLRGSLKVISGLLAKRSPESVRFQTPTMVLGVRGTEFILETLPDNP